jgi:hypothetical protein
MIVKSKKIAGKQIEIHEDAHGRQRFWAKVDGTALFQRGRIRLRTFATADSAWKAALEEVSA